MASASGVKPKKKCYYEVLGIGRNASEDEIKKSFRKLALQQHPDKNLDRAEEAKVEFQQLQQAYEVISNPVERAWYDKHREAVLREGFEQDDDDFIVDLFPYFVSSCFSGYGDDDKGFYTVYRQVFEIIANDEIDAGCEEDIPSFGDSLSGYDDAVGPFYSFWDGYCTCKSFVWKDEYDSRRAGNRHTARFIERENKKIRSEAKKAWNQQVRSLVDFVKRKDKRFQNWRTQQEALRKVKEEENAKKLQQEKAKQREQRKKQLESLKKEREKDQQKITMHMKEMAGVYGEHESNDESDEEEISCLYCAACNKSFRTEKAFENHEKSKKHLAEVEKLREEMEEELSGSEEVEEESEVEHDELQDDENIDEAEEEGEETKDLNQPISSDLSDAVEENGVDEKDVSEKLNGLSVKDDAISSDSDEEPVFAAFVKKGKGKKNKGKGTGQTKIAPPTKSDSDLEETPVSSSVANVSEDGEAESSKPSKKKRRRAKKDGNQTNKATANGTADDECAGEEDKSSAGVDDNVPSRCIVCNQNFPSRSKLFRHIKATGHAAPLATVQATASKFNESGKAGKKKKGGRGRDRES